jgi:hypothetical protein
MFKAAMARPKLVLGAWGAVTVVLAVLGLSVGAHEAPLPPVRPPLTRPPS